jgi:hypothetical protein
MPSQTDIDLAKQLGEIANQAEVTTPEEFQPIKEMARLVVKLLSGEASDADRERGRALVDASVEH